MVNKKKVTKKKEGADSNKKLEEGKVKKNIIEKDKTDVKEPDNEIKDENIDKESQDSNQYDIPKLNFSSFVMMLSLTGMHQLGKIANPVTGKIEVDIHQAQQTIDLLAILEEKTKGNLTSDEENILQTTITDLRLNYVEEVKKHN